VILIVCLIACPASEFKRGQFASLHEGPQNEDRCDGRTENLRFSNDLPMFLELQEKVGAACNKVRVSTQV